MPMYAAADDEAIVWFFQLLYLWLVTRQSCDMEPDTGHLSGRYGVASIKVQVTQHQAQRSFMWTF